MHRPLSTKISSNVHNLSQDNAHNDWQVTGTEALIFGAGVALEGVVHCGELTSFIVL